MKVTIEDVEIELTEEQIKKINAAKLPDKEARLWQLLDGLTMRIDWEKYPNSIHFFRGDRWKAEYDIKNGVLWLRWKDIWSVFERDYGMSYDEIQSFIKKQVEQHFKGLPVTPSNIGTKRWPAVEQHFKGLPVTPANKL